MTAPIVTIKQGRIKGRIREDFEGNPYYSFQGIPFAKPPVGELRFKAPVPAEPWKGTLNATKLGPECPSRYTYFVSNEKNCLNLNVYTPELPNPDNNTPLKPVIVFVHGGGFMYGSNSTILHGPEFLLTEDLVLVCINYRLGVFGFLCLEDPALGVPGNAGLKDIRLALKWVQKNIKNFSGDPGNVTLLGSSAGGAAVHCLYLSSSCQGLFHKVIVQSGSALCSWAKGRANALDIAKNLGYNETDEGKILECLKSTSAYKLVDAQFKILDPFNAVTCRPFVPVVEKYQSEDALLTEELEEIMRQGKFNQVPFLTGFCTRDGILIEGFKYLVKRELVPFHVPDAPIIENEISHDSTLKVGSKKYYDTIAKIKNFYYGDGEITTDRDTYYKLKTDNMFLHPIYRALNLQKHTSLAPIYVYRMSLISPINQGKLILASKFPLLIIFVCLMVFLFGEGFMKKLLLKLTSLVPRHCVPGTGHGDEMTFLFKSALSPTLKPESRERVYLARFLKMWANFARCGNPTPDTDDKLLKVQWKPVSKDEEELCFLDINEELKMENGLEKESMQLWDLIYS